MTGGGPAMYAISVGFAPMMVSSVQATRIVNWREGGEFRRLAITPVALGSLVLGASGAQIMMAFFQGMLIAILGSAAFGVTPTLFGATRGVFIVVLGAEVFVAPGSLVGSLSESLSCHPNLRLRPTAALFPGGWDSRQHLAGVGPEHGALSSQHNAP